MKGSENKIVAQVGIFSGRPNPEVSLTGDTAKKFAELVRSVIGGSEADPPPQPKLGQYYGFFAKLSEDAAERLQLPGEFSVYKGTVSVADKRTASHWRDAADVEKFLIDLAYEQKHGDLLDKAGVKRGK